MKRFSHFTLFVFLFETSFNGMYIGRRECWEKVVDFPLELKQYIVEECRKAVLGDAKRYQELMENFWINR